MSEEKLYAVKNAEGLYLSMNADTPHHWREVLGGVTTIQRIAHDLCTEYGGHVVTIVEEPEKVVITKEQAKIVERAHDATWPATYISGSTGNSDGKESLLIEAYVNGYTVEKEKRYLVELDGLVTTDNAQQYLTKKNGKWFACRRMPGMHQGFTYEELNKAPEWAQQLDREEVADDD